MSLATDLVLIELFHTLYHVHIELWIKSNRLKGSQSWGAARWWSVCLGCQRLQVPFPALQKSKIKSWELIVNKAACLPTGTERAATVASKSRRVWAEEGTHKAIWTTSKRISCPGPNFSWDRNMSTGVVQVGGKAFDRKNNAGKGWTKPQYSEDGLSRGGVLGSTPVIPIPGR